MVISSGIPKMARPLTAGEIQRGFTGRVTTDGRALIKFQGRIFTVPASRVSGLSAKLASQRQQQATRWTAQQKIVVNQRLKALTAANSNISQRPSGSGGSGGGGSGCTPPDSPKCQFNQAAQVPPALQARIDSAKKLARQQQGAVSHNPSDIAKKTTEVSKEKEQVGTLNLPHAASAAAIATRGNSGLSGGGGNRESSFGGGQDEKNRIKNEFNKASKYQRQPLGRGSTANKNDGTSLPRNIREQEAIKQVLSNPRTGETIPITMNDSRWPHSEGWVKMTQTVAGIGEPIIVHYVRNTRTEEVDDFKIVLLGPRPDKEK